MQTSSAGRLSRYGRRRPRGLGRGAGWLWSRKGWPASATTGAHQFFTVAIGSVRIGARSETRRVVGAEEFGHHARCSPEARLLELAVDTLGELAWCAFVYARPPGPPSSAARPPGLCVVSGRRTAAALL